jgi:23S rRNA (guanosine2251-2'-O)-methyltransferase
MAKKKSSKKENELIYGAHPIIEMLRAKKRKLVGIYTTKPLPKSWKRVQRYLPRSVPNIQYVSRAILDRMTGTTDHMGIVAWVSPFRYQKKIFNPKESPFILILDSVQDVRNLGAILRSAYCTGVDGVVLCKKGAAPITAAALKASTGLAEHLNIYLAPSLKHAVLELKKSGYQMYMTVLEDGVNAMEVAYKKPLCLVIGSEATGIAKDIRPYGELITLPQPDPEASFNASVAAGIFLFLLSQK